jgi:hypothetical protein
MDFDHVFKFLLFLPANSDDGYSITKAVLGFREVFGGNPCVSLTMVTPQAPKEDILSFAALVTSDKSIVLLAGEFSDTQLSALISRHNCVVFYADTGSKDPVMVSCIGTDLMQYTCEPQKRLDTSLL